jgi:hypothetical protein
MATRTRARQAPATERPLYDADFHRWSAEQACALRERRPADIDWENVAEEIESLGRSDRQEIASRLTVILAHLLKWRFQPVARSNSWRATLIEQRTRIADLIEESPSLATYPAAILARQYEAARKSAAASSGLPLAAFPADCPYSAEQALDPDFFPRA